MYLMPSTDFLFLLYMFVNIILISETFCNLTIPNGDISSTCGNRVDNTCGNFTCDYGYYKTDMVDTFNCTDSSDWSYNVSLLCIGMYLNCGVVFKRFCSSISIFRLFA